MTVGRNFLRNPSPLGGRFRENCCFDPFHPRERIVGEVRSQGHLRTSVGVPRTGSVPDVYIAPLPGFSGKLPAPSPVVYTSVEDYIALKVGADGKARKISETEAVRKG